MKNEEKLLLVGTGGILFYLMVPVFSTFCDWCCSKIASNINQTQMELEEVTAKHQKQMEEYNVPEQTNTQAIGFQYEDPEEYDDDD